VGALNVDEHREYAQHYQVQGFPTIKLFGANKNAPTDYRGQSCVYNPCEIGRVWWEGWGGEE